MDHTRQPSNAELLAEYSRKRVQEVYEFAAFPDMEADADWSAPLIVPGPRYALEDGNLGVRVVISKNAPRQGAINALKHIVDTLELCESLGQAAPSSLVDLS